MPLQPGTLVNPRVRLVRPLSEGGMGTVWVAEHLTLAREVAVKFILEGAPNDPELLERFEEEAKAAAQIQSPHVVQIFDYGTSAGDGRPYIVMELLKGNNLADWLDLVGQLDRVATLSLVDQVGKALGKAHARGIVHRDIKPENIFLVDDDDFVEVPQQHVKVLDFGVAKQSRRGTGALTSPGQIIGTPEYMCPDQVLRSEPVDAHTDLWAFAVVTYTCLTGKLPFTGDTLAQLIGALARGDFEPPTSLRDDLRPEVDEFFQRALNPDRSQRFSTAADFTVGFRHAMAPPDSSVEVRLNELVAIMEARAKAVLEAAAQNEGAADDGDDPIDSFRATEPDGQAPPIDGPTATTPGQARGLGPTLLASERSLEPEPEQPDRPQARRIRFRLHSRAGIAVIGGGCVIAGALTVLLLRGPETGPTEAPAKPPPAIAMVKPLNRPQLARISAGWFNMGCQGLARACPEDQQPTRKVTLDAFGLDETEITVAQYRDCVEAAVCSVQNLTGGSLPGSLDPLRCNWNASGRESYPINCVSWEEAADYCRWVGGSLPTEAQWERAARGSDDRRYPWGEELPSCAVAVMGNPEGDGCGRKLTWSVGSRPAGRSPFGLLDLAGNVREWVADWYDPKAYAATAADVRNPAGPATGTEKVVRGGGFQDGPHDLLATARQHLKPTDRAVDVGFRCVRPVY